MFGKFSFCSECLDWLFECDFRVEFIQLAKDYQPLNLGQGFPDDIVPDFVIDCLRDAIQDNNIMMHQYARAFVSLHLALIVLSIFLIRAAPTW